MVLTYTPLRRQQHNTGKLKRMITRWGLRAFNVVLYIVS